MKKSIKFDVCHNSDGSPLSIEVKYSFLEFKKNKIPEGRSVEGCENLQLIKCNNAILQSTYKNNILKINKLYGEYYFMNFYSNYFHMIIDEISVFLYLKKNNPNLKIILFIPKDNSTTIFADNEASFKDEVHPMLIKYIEIFKMLNVEYYIWNQNLENLEVKSLLFFNNNATGHSPKITSFLMQTEQLVDLLSNQFSQSKLWDSANKKIFISRIYRDYEEVASIDQSNFTQIEKDALRSQLSRIIIDNYLLEDYFKLLGFQVVHLEKMTFKEQLILFGSSNFVVGFTGTGLLNTIFCPPKSKVIEIQHCYFSESFYKHAYLQKNHDWYHLYFEESRAKYIIQKLKILNLDNK